MPYPFRLACAAVLVALLSPLHAQERVTLTAPVAKASATSIQIERITIDVKAKSIYVQWLFDNGDADSAVYTTPAPVDHPAQPTGAVLFSTLNTSNLTTVSMVKRILQRLQADGYVKAGSIAGTPE